jgi:hypothetical protein
MEYRNRLTGEVLGYQELLQAVTNAYIPPAPTEQYMDALGYDIIQEVVPVRSKYTEMVRFGVEQGEDGKWRQVWRAIPWTSELIEQDQVHQESLVEIEREKMWAHIQEERSRRKFGGVQANGLWFHSDNDSRVQWLGLARKADLVIISGESATAQLMVDGKPLVWKRLGGGFVQVTAAMAIAVVEAIETLDAQAHEAAEVHNMSMRALADPRGYDFSQGWPMMKSEIDEELV